MVVMNEKGKFLYCPFCGSLDISVSIIHISDMHESPIINCNSCGVSVYGTPDGVDCNDAVIKAAEYWNRRV